MATENTTVAIKVTANTDAANGSVKSFKAQLRDATSELVNMSEKFGVTSKEAAAAAKKVAGLKDAIGDAKALAETFNPDKKFVALGGALQGAVGGFSALQGAMGLFGSEGKEVEKMMLKVQSAMALQQGISGIMGAKDSFQLMANTIKGSVVKSFSTLKGAIISTGIGLLVVALGLLIANFDEVKKFMEKLFPGLAKLGSFFSKLIDNVTDFIGVTNEASRAQQKFIKDTEKGIKEQELLLDANGYKYDQYTQRKIKANIDYNKKVVEINKNEALSEKEKADQIKQYNDKANFEIQQADKDRNTAINDEAEKQAEKRKAAAEKAAAEQKKLDEAEKKRLEDLDKFRRDLQTSFNKDKAQALTEAEAEFAFQESEQERQAALEKSYADAAILLRQQNTEKVLAADKAEKDKLKQNEIDLANAKKEIQDSVFNNISAGLNLIQSLAGKNKALQAAALIAESAVGIAKIVINTQAANAAARLKYALIPGGLAIAKTETLLNNISAGIGIAANLKATATGLKGLNSGGAPSAPSIGAAAGTSAPLTPQAQSTRLDQGSINAIGQASARSYVLESDITSHQERIQRLQRAARIN